MSNQQGNQRRNQHFQFDTNSKTGRYHTGNPWYTANLYHSNNHSVDRLCAGPPQNAPQAPHDTDQSHTIKQNHIPVQHPLVINQVPFQQPRMQAAQLEHQVVPLEAPQPQPGPSNASPLNSTQLPANYRSTSQSSIEHETDHASRTPRMRQPEAIQNKANLNVAKQAEAQVQQSECAQNQVKKPESEHPGTRHTGGIQSEASKSDASGFTNNDASTLKPHTDNAPLGDTGSHNPYTDNRYLRYPHPEYPHPGYPNVRHTYAGPPRVGNLHAGHRHAVYPHSNYPYTGFPYVSHPYITDRNSHAGSSQVTNSNGKNTNTAKIQTGNKRPGNSHTETRRSGDPRTSKNYSFSSGYGMFRVDPSYGMNNPLSNRGTITIEVPIPTKINQPTPSASSNGEITHHKGNLIVPHVHGKVVKPSHLPERRRGSAFEHKPQEASKTLPQVHTFNPAAPGKEKAPSPSSNLSTLQPLSQPALNVLNSSDAQSIPRTAESNAPPLPAKSSASSISAPSNLTTKTPLVLAENAECNRIVSTIDIIEKILSKLGTNEGLLVAEIQRRVIAYIPKCSFLYDSIFNSTISRILEDESIFHSVESNKSGEKCWGINRSFDYRRQYRNFSPPVLPLKHLKDRLKDLGVSQTTIEAILELEYSDEVYGAKDLLHGAFLARPYSIALTFDEVYQMVILLYPKQRFAHIKAKLTWLLKTSANFSCVLTPQNTTAYILNDSFRKANQVRGKVLQEYFKERLLKLDYNDIDCASFLFSPLESPEMDASKPLRTTELQSKESQIESQIELHELQVVTNHLTDPPRIQDSAEDDVTIELPDTSEAPNSPSSRSNLNDEPSQPLRDSMESKEKCKDTDHRGVSNKENNNKDLNRENRAKPAHIIPGPVMPLVEQPSEQVSDTDNESNEPITVIPEEIPHFELDDFTLITGAFLALPSGKEMSKHQVHNAIKFLYSTQVEEAAIYHIMSKSECFRRIDRKRTPYAFVLDEVYGNRRLMRAMHLKSHMAVLLQQRKGEIKSSQELDEILDEVINRSKDEPETPFSDLIVTVLQKSPNCKLTARGIQSELLKLFPYLNKGSDQNLMNKIYKALNNTDIFVKVSTKHNGVSWTLRKDSRDQIQIGHIDTNVDGSKSDCETEIEAEIGFHTGITVGVLREHISVVLKKSPSGILSVDSILTELNELFPSYRRGYPYQILRENVLRIVKWTPEFVIDSRGSDEIHHWMIRMKDPRLRTQMKRHQQRARTRSAANSINKETDPETKNTQEEIDNEPLGTGDRNNVSEEDSDTLVLTHITIVLLNSPSGQMTITGILQKLRELFPDHWRAYSEHSLRIKAYNAMRKSSNFKIASKPKTGHVWAFSKEYHPSTQQELDQQRVRVKLFVDSDSSESNAESN